MNRTLTEYLVIHCSDTYPTMDIGLAEIKKWHTTADPNDPSKPWSDIGYHYVIRRNGLVEHGRDIKAIGSHVRGFNSCSIGVCMVGGKGGNNFTALQWAALEKLVKDIQKMYDGIEVVAHHELNSGKTCPNFDVQKWLLTIGEKQ